MIFVILILFHNITFSQDLPLLKPYIFNNNPTIEYIQKPEIETAEKNQAIKSFNEESFLEKTIISDEYILGPGDIIGINILMGENLTLTLKVTPTGDVFIPSVGVVYVSGLTFKKCIEKIKNYIIESSYPNAKVSVALINIRKFQIQIIGAVSKPGFITVSAVDRLDRIVSRAEGFHQLAREFDITIVRKNGSLEKVNYLDYKRSGSLSENPTFLEGDKVIVPFGNVAKESIILRGAVQGTGYDILEPNETLINFLNRNIKLDSFSDLQSVIITRNQKNSEEFIRVLPIEFEQFKLLPGDIIDILRERGIMVNGFIQEPGAYEFVPGFTIADYISIAGGNTIDGDPNRAIVYHPDGSIYRGKNKVLNRGDIIVVPRSYLNRFVGRMSILQIIGATLSVYMTYLAATS